MSRSVALTTEDNPFDPIDEFDDWFAFDNSKGYGTCSYLARLAVVNDSLPDETNAIELERAIDQIIINDPRGIYRKIVRENT